MGRGVWAPTAMSSPAPPHAHGRGPHAARSGPTGAGAGGVPAFSCCLYRILKPERAPNPADSTGPPPMALRALHRHRHGASAPLPGTECKAGSPCRIRCGGGPPPWALEAHGGGGGGSRRSRARDHGPAMGRRVTRRGTASQWPGDVVHGLWTPPPTAGQGGL